MNILLQGVVGSTAYGLATPQSDVDRCAVFAFDTIDTFKLSKPAESVVTHEPDLTLHEAEKFVRLALSCNPSVLEMLYLGSYESQTTLGWELVVLRYELLSARRVKAAYLGYVTQQMTRFRLARIQKVPTQPDKVAKYARHVARLLFQGYQLYRTGSLPVRLPNAEQVHQIGEAAASGNTEPLDRFVQKYEDRFNSGESCLPTEPNPRVFDDWLVRVRMAYLPTFP